MEEPISLGLFTSGSTSSKLLPRSGTNFSREMRIGCASHKLAQGVDAARQAESLTDAGGGQS